MSSETQTWKDKITFLTPNFEAHNVNGRDLKFYPISVGVLFKMREMAKPLAGALRALLVKNSSDTQETHRRFPNLENKEIINTETIISAISPDLAKFRAENEEAAVRKLLDVLMDEKNAATIGELIVDSLRDEFQGNKLPSAECATLVRSMDMTTLKDMLVGLAKGNKKILGPFGDLLGQNLGKVLSVVSTVVERTKPATSSPVTTSSST